MAGGIGARVGGGKLGVRSGVKLGVKPDGGGGGSDGLAAG